MTALRLRMIEDMRLRNFSPHTQEAYVRAVRQFAQYFRVSPDELGGEDVRRYLLHLVQERRVSWSLYNVSRCAPRFFFQVTLGRDGDEPFGRVPSARERRRLPDVLSPDELRRLFAVARSAKQKAMLTTLYGSGVRVS